MPGYIPDKTIEEIQSRCDIVQVIGSYIPLKKAGANFKTTCPFHKEKTPSFLVSPAKQIYHCFGCGAGGDVFSFVMRHENVDFPEAVEILAKRAGVAVPRRAARENAEPGVADKLYRINELASRFYHEILLTKDEGKLAYEYLRRRGVSDEVMRRFQLGFAPNEWTVFLQYASQKGYQPKDLLAAGLVLKKEETGSHYDRFRNRIIFPICDARGRIVAQAGRVLDDSLPKYMNSPETPIYVKSKILYGLYASKEAIRERGRVVMVEGYMDFLALHQHGFSEAVATCGTSLTSDQIRLLKRFTDTVVIVFDPDLAGENATLRNLDLFLEDEMKVKVIRLPDGADPDLFLKQRGAGEFKRLLDGASILFDYKLGLMLERYGTRSLEEKLSVAKEMLPTIRRVKNSIEQSEYFKRLAEVLRVDEAALRQEMGRTRPVSPTATSPKRREEKRVPASGGFAENRAEMFILGLMLQDETFIERVRTDLGLDYFHNPIARRIADAICRLAKEDQKVTPSRLIRHMDNEIAARFIAELVSCSEEIDPGQREKCFFDCASRLKREAIDAQVMQLREEIKTAELEKNWERIDTLLEKYNSLMKLQIR